MSAKLWRSRWIALKTVFWFWTSARSWRSLRDSASKTSPPFLTTPLSAADWASSNSVRSPPASTNLRQAAERVVEVQPTADDAGAQVLLPCLERAACVGIEGVQDLVDLGHVLHSSRPPEHAVLGQRRGVLRDRSSSRRRSRR